ncbi:AVAST type 3 anti-phage proein Avs3b [Rhizobium leguminosarum]|uniref:AVAST type 3 anti-phage proein Avs3b n=1 Tax=Rhizobium leguminosarum TaxID=384 RepID=UPI001C943B5E|nr:AVAST type 3 anti-phage proein Avs3b [Rhizobium leguminosarum]MBY5466339.1 hypothetical protein [Rhizobium leguminosarum]
MTDSTSSDETVSSTLPTDVSELGRLLVRQLGRAGIHNTLAGWMSHYIAELMQAAEAAVGDERSVKMALCSQVILELWAKADVLPDGIRPFQGLEPILRALESLDPGDDTPRYLRPARRPYKADEESDASRQWLECVEGLDYSARILIRFCLARASEGALDTTKEWVIAAKLATEDNSPVLPVFRFLSDETKIIEDPSTEQKQDLEERLRRLEAFSLMATTIAAGLRAELEELDAGQDQP